MVHSLEHGAVEIYYVQGGSKGLTSDVVGALSEAANQDKVITTPAPQALDPGLVNGKSFPTAIAFAAWDNLQQCPATVTGTQARIIAQGFIAEFRNASSAPEARLPI
jgi:hypothetical protein